MSDEAREDAEPATSDGGPRKSSVLGVVAAAVAGLALFFILLDWRSLKNEVERLRHPPEAALILRGLPDGAAVEARLTREPALWQPPSEPWSRAGTAVDGTARLALPAGAFEVTAGGTTFPVLLTPGLELEVEAAPAPPGFARIPPGPFFARLGFSLETARGPGGEPHGPRGFLISETEVSIREYRAFLTALRRRRGQPGEGPVEPRQSPLPHSPWCSDEEKDASPDGCLGHRPVVGGVDQWETLDDGEDKDEVPVRFVSWFDALAYCAFASQGAGGRLRLPTRSEWEKASRGVDGRPFPWGYELMTPAERAMFGVGLHVRSHPKLRSPYGLFHTASGVSEWAATAEGRSRRHVMGSSWDVHRDQIHLGYGVGESPWLRDVNLGFRVVLEAAP